MDAEPPTMDIPTKKHLLIFRSTTLGPLSHYFRVGPISLASFEFPSFMSSCLYVVRLVLA